MKNLRTYILFFLFFILGVTASLYADLHLENNTGHVQPNITENLRTEDSSGDPDRLLLYEKVNKLEIQADSLSRSMGNLNLKIDSVLDMLVTNDSVNRTQPEDQPGPGVKAEISSNEITLAKGRIFANLSDTSTSLPDILESADMKNLPADERDEVLGEIARRLDAGEIDKSQFLPGYTAY